MREEWSAYNLRESSPLVEMLTDLEVGVNLRYKYGYSLLGRQTLTRAFGE